MVKSLAVMVVALVGIGLALSPAPKAFGAVVYVKWDSPGPAFDGNSWDTAYHSIQQGLDDAVATKGGYSGVGDARDIRANVTVVDPELDSGQAGGGHTVTGADTASIDGFTI